MTRVFLALVTVLMLVFGLAPPIITPAFAEEASWQADPPKPDSGPVEWCNVSASAGGDSYMMRVWAPIDDGFDHRAYAQRVFPADVQRAMAFKFKTPHEITLDSVNVTCDGDKARKKGG